MLLEHPAQQTALAGLTERAPAAAPRFSFHSGYYCETCSHDGCNTSALLSDGCTERDAVCVACCTYDDLELPGERVSCLGQRCANHGSSGCDRRLRDGAWIVSDRAESFALCFQCAVAEVIESAPLTLCVEAVNIVGGEPVLNDVLAVLGYRTSRGSSFYRKNILSSFGDVVLADASALMTWAWLATQGVKTHHPTHKQASTSAAITRGVLALQPAIAEALRLRRELLATASIADEVA